MLEATCSYFDLRGRAAPFAVALLCLVGMPPRTSEVSL